MRKVDFHAFQSLALEERLSQFGRSSGKLPTERSEEDGMATIQSLVMGSLARIAFSWHSSILLMYYGTQGSLFQKSTMFFMRETIVVDSSPLPQEVILSRS